MERVFLPVKFSKDQKIQAVNVSVGDMIKSRYSKYENGKIYLDTCLVGKDPTSKDIAGSKGEALLSGK